MRLASILAVITIVSLGMLSCSSSSPSSTSSPWNPTSPTAETPVGTPSFSESEIRAMVRNYLQSQIDRAAKYARLSFSSTLTEASPKFSATYFGNGEWRVQGLGGEYNSDDAQYYYYHTGGEWKVYETSLIVEPANAKAESFLRRVRSQWE